jgi:spore photoproduct lyase
MSIKANTEGFFWPQKIYVEAEARRDPIAIRVIDKFTDAEVVEVDTAKDPISELCLEGPKGASMKDEASRFTLGKSRLFLGRYKGQWLKKCPGTNNHVCCNLWITSPVEGCPYECTYCYLQSYQRRNPTQKIYTNTEDMLEEIAACAKASPDRFFRICTGELADSLVWDGVTELSRELVPFFAEFPNLVLELKTKSTEIGNLLEMADQHRGRTVVSWTLNARSVAESDELYAPSIEQRIEAARAVIKAGYRVAFHFDPMVHFADWQSGYGETLELLRREIDPRSVAWISVASLRYKREMQGMMRFRFPQSKLPYGEQFLANDNKLRYIQPLRLQMMRFMWKKLKAWHQALPVYMCMESPTVWKLISGGPPAAGAELVELFSRKGKKVSDSNC